MKKILVIVLIVVFAFMFLPACGNDNIGINDSGSNAASSNNNSSSKSEEDKERELAIRNEALNEVAISLKTYHDAGYGLVLSDFAKNESEIQRFVIKAEGLCGYSIATIDNETHVFMIIPIVTSCKVDRVGMDFEKHDVMLVVDRCDINQETTFFRNDYLNVKPTDKKAAKALEIFQYKNYDYYFTKEEVNAAAGIKVENYA